VELLLRVFFLSIILCFCVVSCRDLSNYKSLAPELNQSSLKEITTPPKTFEAPVKRKSFPVKAEIPIPENMKQLVSVTISEKSPLKQVLIELARQTDVDLQLDSKIDSKITFSANNRSLIKVIEEMCDLAGLRFRILGSSLRIELDQPYPENYNVQFLNLSRNSQNRISIATDVFSNGNSSGQQKAQVDNGSNSAVTVNGSNDFWAELENNLKIILAQDSDKEATYSVHKQGGLISIFATSKQHRLIVDYLQKLRRVSSTQVLIEAKIVEVSLADQFKSGIDWKKLNSKGDWQFDAQFGAITQKSRFFNSSNAQGDMVSLGLSGQTFASILKAIDEFGSSRTLSSPRLTVMNNQTAILKVAQNQVYFRLNYDKQFSTTNNTQSVSVSSDIQTVPIGLVMSVQPSIDPDTGDIILFLRPTVSRLSRSVSDPAVDIAYNASLNADTSGSVIQPKPSLVPVVEVREIDSVLRLKSEEIAILGGLMEVRSIQDRAKFPVLGDVPFLKELLSGNVEGDEVIELVILLRASIYEDSPAPDATDRRLLKDYTNDPRPVQF
jgi:general secretion pathway protein D